MSDPETVNLAPDSILASFDIQSLFTKIPVKETIETCISYLLDGKNKFVGITKALFRSMPQLFVLNSYFILIASYITKKMVYGWVYP